MKTKRTPNFITLIGLAFGVGVAAQAQPVITNIAMVPRLTILSEVGSANEIQYATDLGQPNWAVLTNLVVAESPYWFVDVAAPPAPLRFYRVLAFQATISGATNMALIPPGWFTMGTTFYDGYLDELPLHTVYVSAFYMDKYEVTKALWDEVYQWATNHDYSFVADADAFGKAASHPVVDVTWYAAVKWCNARSEKEGRTPAYYTSAGQNNVYRSGQTNVQNDWVKWDAGYRLPTEAEWEKAARGGARERRFPWADTDTITHSRANYNSSSSFAYDISLTRGFHPTFNDGTGTYTGPVGYFAPNGYGLYDMSGNVWEWCWDWYGSYSSSSQTDPRGPVPGSYRVLRGGSWYWEPGRTAFRNLNYPPDLVNNSFGFRSVLPASHP